MVTYESFKNGCLEYGVTFSEYSINGARAIRAPIKPTKDNRVIYVSFLFHDFPKTAIISSVPLNCVPGALRKMIANLEKAGSPYYYDIKGDELFVSEVVNPNQIDDAPELMARGVSQVNLVEFIVNATGA